MKVRMTKEFAAVFKRYSDKIAGFTLESAQAKEVDLRDPSTLGNLPDEVKLGRLEVSLDDKTFLGAERHEEVRKFLKQLINTGVKPDVMETAPEEVVGTPPALPSEPPLSPQSEDEWDEVDIAIDDLELMSREDLREIGRKCGITVKMTWGKEKLIKKIKETQHG